jgi:hypothetical protein
MPSTSRRRLLRRGSVCLAGLFAGCLGDDVTDPATETSDTPTASPTEQLPDTPQLTGTYADDPTGPAAYPNRPEDPTRETVTEYVQAFERARTENSLHASDVTDLSASARTHYDTAAHGGHYVLAMGSGYANYEDGTHADWGQLHALYFVAPDLTVRIEDRADYYFDCETVYAAEDTAENFAQQCEGTSAEYLLYNFRPEERQVTVTVEYLGENGTETALERTRAVAGTTALEQGSVTYRQGTYRVMATLDDGRAATYEWDLSLAPDGSPTVTVLVTPVGGITVRPVPFDELY